jgi:hypothetical protein
MVKCYYFKGDTIEGPDIIGEIPIVTIKADGGPQAYYDLPVGAITLNDLIEDHSDKYWLGDSFHLSNIMKAAWRWGIKAGTSKDYDARKFIYSGCRLLMKHAGVKAVRDTLQQMLNDPQFQEKN